MKPGEELCRSWCADEWENHGRINPCVGCYLHETRDGHAWCDDIRASKADTGMRGRALRYMNRYHNRETQ